MIKTFWFKAWNARNSRAIAKFQNAEAGRFNHKMSIHDLFRGSLGVYKMRGDSEELHIDQYCCPVNKKKLSKQADVAGLDKACTNPRHEPDASTIDTP